MNPAFQHTGWWYEYFSGDSLQISAVNEPLTLEAGEYRLYSDEKLGLPWWLTATETFVAKEDFPFVLFPNPTNGNFTIHFKNSMKNLTVEIYSISGQLVSTYKDITTLNTAEIPFDGSPGIYFVKVSDGQRAVVRKLVVQ
ncbi:MAG TPA: T9SS type A sorting domain-containing protein [Saprospiraceae bacterium]|nr:T9SS type A sorting domain-containing protein [Saprospiraceae bacterium]